MITGFEQSSICFKRSCRLGAPEARPCACSSSSFMSAPATNVRPAPMITTADTDGSCSTLRIAAEIPSGTPGESAFTGGLSIVTTATPLVLDNRTISLMYASIACARTDRMSHVKLTVPADAPDYPTILHAMEDVARRTPDRHALICEDRSLTFAQHKSAIAGFARRLQKIGVEGERVAILMTNCLEMPVCILGAMAAHAYVAPMNPNYSDSELTPLLKDTTPKVIVTLPEFYSRLSKVAGAMGIPHVLVVGEGSNTIASWISEGSEGLPQPLPNADDYAMMFFTGGTTGLPKGAEHRHRHIMAFCRLEAAFFSTLEYDKEVSLSVAPMFHIFGHHHGVIHPLYLGSTHVLVRQYKPDIVLEQLSRYKVTLFAGGPSTVYVGILAAVGIKNADLSNLKICCAGASPFSEDLLTNWQKTTGCPIYEGVGMSEGAPYANNPVTGKRKVLSVGLPPPGAEVEVVDLEAGTRVMPPYERGEIRVRGPQMIESYRNRPEETAKTIRDRWVYTGDIGYFDDEGYL